MPSSSPLSARHDAVAIFGGTFDPIHHGHLRAASELADQLQVRDFRLLPAGQPAHRDRTEASAEQRLAMVRLALQAHPDLGLDDREVRRSGRSFMVDTLSSVRAESGAKPVLLCLGQDAANDLLSWHEWPRLFELAHLVVMRRPDSRMDYPSPLAEEMQRRQQDQVSALMNHSAGGVCHLTITQLAISATDIRQQLARGVSPRFLLPSSVLAYIHQHQLYQSNRDC